MKMSWSTERGQLVSRWSETEDHAYDASWMLSMNGAPVAARAVASARGVVRFGQVLAAGLAAVIWWTGKWRGGRYASG